MKKIVFVCMLAGMVLCAGSTFAQERQGMDPRNRRKVMVERLQQELGLSAEQTRQVEAIYAESDARMRENMPPREEGVRPGREQMQERMKNNREETDRKIKAVLTPEQAAKYTALQQEREKRDPRPASADRRKGKRPARR